MAVAPGAVVRIAGEPGCWRVLEAGVEAMATRLTLAPLAAAMLAATGASSGRVAGAVDVPVGATVLHVAELPALDDGLLTVPRITVLATGTGSGWRRAALLWSADDGASWVAAGATGAAAVIGRVESITPVTTTAVRDAAGAIVVRLARADMTLDDADDAALADGANMVVAGGELIQFGRAESLGDRRWRLTRLLRGRRGTEAQAAVAGDGFGLIDPAGARTIDLPLAAIGREVRVMASGVGDDEPVKARLMLAGASVRPPAPVHLRREGGVLHWTRRSRGGWRWSDGGDAPLVEETERYRVTVAAGGSVRDVATTEPFVAITADAGAVVTVRQGGTWAESAPATIIW